MQINIFFRKFPKATEFRVSTAHPVAPTTSWIYFIPNGQLILSCPPRYSAVESWCNEYRRAPRQQYSKRHIVRNLGYVCAPPVSTNFNRFICEKKHIRYLWKSVEFPRFRVCFICNLETWTWKFLDEMFTALSNDCNSWQREMSVQRSPLLPVHHCSVTELNS